MVIENTNEENASDATPAENVVTYTAYSAADEAIIPEVIETPPPATEVVPDDIPPVAEQEAEEEIDIEDIEELDEQTAFELLKSKRGFDFENIDALLTPKEQKKYAPQLEKFQEFIEKTGNENFNDFLETQKDWGAEKEEVVLRELIKSENPLATQKEIDFLYNKKYSIANLDEEDDEDEILEKGINTKTDLKKAQDFLEKRKQEYLVDRGSDDHIPEAYREAKAFKENLEQQHANNEIANQAVREDYVAQTESYFSKDFDGIKVQLGNDEIGFEEVSIKPDNLAELKAKHLDISNFNNKFFDQEGKIVDSKGWHEALYMAENYKEELNKAYNRGMAKKAELDDKLSKNIQPDNIRDIPGAPASKTTYTVVKD